MMKDAFSCKYIYLFKFLSVNNNQGWGFMHCLKAGVLQGEVLKHIHLLEWNQHRGAILGLDGQPAIPQGH